MPGRRLGVGVVGADRWAILAHLPGWARDRRCQLVGVCDTEPGRARAAALEFGVAVATPDYRELLKRDGICETLKVARPDDVESKEVEVPSRYYPAGGSPRESWRTLYYANLTANFASEVLGEVPGNEGNFADGLWVQEVVNAVEISHHERRWVDLSLPDGR